MKSRRKFLKIGSLALFGGLVLGGSQNIFSQTTKGKNLFPVPPETLADTVSNFRSSTFEPLIDSFFSFRRTDLTNSGATRISNISLRLVEVVAKENAVTASGKNLEGFSLIFEMTGKAKPEDKIYTVSHPSLGDFEIFISSVGKSGKRFQAIFNRIYS